MDVNGGSYNSSTQSEEDNMDLRRGPWTVEEDILLMNYIANHGEGRWNSLAHCAGLKRTGKSCRLRWLNYLRPDVRRGNITLEEQLLILELHSRWGNRWSKIAQHLPGRTDNEIKNYWRTRVQKHAKQLQCDVNSKQFKDTMKYLWMPRLVERIQAASVSSSTTTTTTSTHHHHHNPSFNNGGYHHHHHHDEQQSHLPMGNSTNISEGTSCPQINQSFITSENSSSNRVTTTTAAAAAAASASASSPSEISTVSDYNNLLVDESQHVYDYNTQNTHFNFSESLISPIGNYFNQGLEFHQGAVDQQNNNSMWLGGEDMNLWNVEEDMWFLQPQQQQFCNGF